MIKKKRPTIQQSLETYLKDYKNTNCYFQKDPQMFKKIIDLVLEHPNQFSTFLNYPKLHPEFVDLCNWIHSCLPLLADKKYTIQTKIFWILTGRCEFPRCQNESCQTTIYDNVVSLTYGYKLFCCNHCQVTSKQFKAQRIATWESNYGKGCTSPSKNPLVRKKQEETCLRNLGVRFPMQSKMVVQLSRNSKLDKYGNATFVNQEKASKTRRTKYNGKWESFEATKSRKQTNNDRYGCDYYVQSMEFREKSEQTSLQSYGCKSPNQAEVVKQNKIKAFQSKYGLMVINAGQTEQHQNVYKDPQRVAEIQTKLYNSKKRNGSFNTSKPEQRCLKLLQDKFGVDDIAHQYKSKLYPFQCDFYIKSMDLYIELNASWVHFDHFFDPNNLDDVRLANWLKEQAEAGHSYYLGAYNTWTKSDPKKATTAIANNLHYLVFWSEQELLDWIASVKLENLQDPQ